MMIHFTAVKQILQACTKLGIKRYKSNSMLVSDFSNSDRANSMDDDGRSIGGFAVY
jgi:hypothetical protein